MTATLATVQLAAITAIGFATAPPAAGVRTCLTPRRTPVTVGALENLWEIARDVDDARSDLHLFWFATLRGCQPATILSRVFVSAGDADSKPRHSHRP